MNGEPSHTAAYLWPVVRDIIEAHDVDPDIFEIGCGNGSTAEYLTREIGARTTGIDIDADVIATAQRRGHGNVFRVASVYDLDGAETRPVVVALEVIEHCADSRGFMRAFRSVMAPGGIGILSTPYHGYLKNVAVALAGKHDHHFDPLWEGGHLKFFSIAKLRQLFVATGFERFEFIRVGRVPWLAKSVVCVLYR